MELWAPTSTGLWYTNPTVVGGVFENKYILFQVVQSGFDPLINIVLLAFADIHKHK